ncbi:MAG: radical SAM protein [Cyanosarcina radialis HA8281-LM2]|jgi:MoaA/NifB/PqqE/SkfB family radical SAM enzyme|nr:radical SAM protein [Cyanosarcina radialis HA8281-LM2]
MSKADNSAVSFCTLPFTHLNTNATGDVRVCCYVERPIGNFHDSDFDSIWHSEFASELRESIFDQTFRFCNKEFCSIAAKGDPNALEDAASKQEIESLRDRYSGRPRPELLSLQHDDSCNLSCPQCRSGLIYADAERQQTLKDIQDEWLKSPIFRSAQRILLSGNGDPFASRVYSDFLHKIKKADFPDLEITILTNGLLLNQARWDSLANAHYAIRHILISVDAASAETYSKVRRGGDFAKLIENLEFVSQLRKSQAIESFAIKFVTSAENFMEMPDFVRLAKRLGCDRVKFQLIVRFNHLSVAEYSAVAIQHPKHPRHSELLAVLKDPILQDDIVKLVNFHSVGEENFSFVEDYEAVMASNNIEVADVDKKENAIDRILYRFLGLVRRVGRRLPTAVKTPLKQVFKRVLTAA